MTVAHDVLRGVIEHYHSHYDAQIWAAARPGQVGVILSEVLNARAVPGGVTFTWGQPWGREPDGASGRENACVGVGRCNGGAAD